MNKTQIPVPWLENVEVVESRAAGIGGTDISAILGFNPYKTPFDVFLEKTGQGTDLPANSAMEWGNRLEPVVASAYADRMGVNLIKNSLTYRHAKYPFMTGTPDYFLSEPYGLDCKTAGFWMSKDWGDDGTDEVPDHYLCQCQWYMALTGARAWDVPVLIGGNDFRVYPIQRNEHLIASMIEAGAAFWRDHVEVGVAPEIKASDAANEWLKKHYAKHRAALRAASVEEADLASQYLMLKRETASVEAALEDVAVKLKASIGDAEGITGPFGKITWKANKDGQKTDWQGLAQSFTPTSEQIATFTTTTTGARPLKAYAAK